MEFVLAAQPIDEHGVIGGDYVAFVSPDAAHLIERVDFHAWLEARKPGEAWDLTLEVRA